MWTCPRCARTFAARHQTHACPEEVDEQVADWLAEAYQVGLQRHR
jgi:transposase-like protein